tara:strand:+ start:337 stop:711 length:375 start_codon:yes stop_codon:yes gene_type:complete
MYRILVLILLLIGCGENIQKPSDNIKYLKSLGYKEFLCRTVDFIESDINYYELKENLLPVDKDKAMLVARCLKNDCEFKEISQKKLPEEFVCQRFYDDEDFTSEFPKDSIILMFNVKVFNDIKE